MRCNEIIKTADYEKTNNYIMKMIMRDDYSEEERRDTRTADDEENVKIIIWDATMTRDATRTRENEDELDQIMNY